jgi:hypothetical protein
VSLRPISEPAAPATLAALVGDRVRPVTLAGVKTLPVAASLRPLFPEGGLRRGSTVSVGQGAASGGTSLALSVLQGASSSGSWCAAVGFPELGLVAAAQLGLGLDRLALIPNPGGQWPVVVAALLDGVDVVLFRLPGRIREVDARRLAARARERGSVIVALGEGWPGADLRLAVTSSAWRGHEHSGGYLRERQVEIVATGRRAAAGERRVTVALDPQGRLAAATVHKDPEMQTVEGGRLTRLPHAAGLR